MAQVKLQCGLSQLEKSNHFHRLVDLHFTCLRAALSKYFEVKILKQSGKSLKAYLAIPQIQTLAQTKLSESQRQIVENSNPNLEAMDCTLLTLLILHKTNDHLMDKKDKTCLRTLRESRNNIAHHCKAELENDDQFNADSALIQKISADLGDDFKTANYGMMSEIRKRENVKVCTNMDKILLNGEYYMVKLVQADSADQVYIEDRLYTITEVNLWKWIRQLSRYTDVSIMLQILRDEGVIDSIIQRQIEEEYNNGSKMEALVLHLQRNTKENVFKFCRCLRKLDPKLADLVEHSSSDGKEIAQYLTTLERSYISRILSEHLVEKDGSTVNCEDVHIFTETTLQISCSFETIVGSFREVFPNVRIMENDTSFAGVSWGERGRNTANIQNSIEVSQTPIEENVEDMNCEEFAKYIGHRMGKVKPVLNELFYEAFNQKFITAKTFIQMSEEHLRQEMPPCTKYNEPGVKMSLLDIQKELKERLRLKCNVSNKDVVILRKFDSAANSNMQYTYHGTVKPVYGNLLEPIHEFRHYDREQPCHFIAKEVVIFVAACMNGRKNGTIHFGIRDNGNGSADIIGMDELSLKQVNTEITTSLKSCFYPNNIRSALNIARPAQAVRVGEISKLAVYEVDVVPSSYFCCNKILPIMFPPKGFQKEHVFVYDLNQSCEICKLDPAQVQVAKTEVYNDIFKERTRLEREHDMPEGSDQKLEKRLADILTSKGTYVTDAHVPIIVSGNITGAENEAEIRQKLDITHALMCSEFVIDFDESPILRQTTERGKTTFYVQMAEHFNDRIDLSLFRPPVWLYANGLQDMAMERMDFKTWSKCRHSGVKRCFETIRSFIPNQKALLIFLLYQEPVHGSSDPILEIARDAITCSFRDQCVVIAEKTEFVDRLRDIAADFLDTKALRDTFHTGLSLCKMSEVFNSVFHQNPNVACNLPVSLGGHFVEMTIKERDALGFKNIQILSGTQCDTETEVAQRRNKGKGTPKHAQCEQERFYKGNMVTWWNFYYANQVGRRDCLETHLHEIKSKLTSCSRPNLVEWHDIDHHPGAGGSTLGRHLLWTLSQFHNVPENSYRCCLVHIVSNNTVQEIETFRKFKDSRCPKPVVLLVDNIGEEDIESLWDYLNESAYKNGISGKLYCLVIHVKRQPILVVPRSTHILKHQLTPNEKQWFETKYRELEKSAHVKVNTLIAFNVMRHSFDKKYTEDLTGNIMKSVKHTERQMLKYLSVICSFDSNASVPLLVLEDTLHGHQNLKPNTLPYTISSSLSQKRPRDFWGQMSDAMMLLINKRYEHNSNRPDVYIISQPLSQAIRDLIITLDGVTLEAMVHELLDVLQRQVKESNPLSKRFVRIVCSLFKHRRFEKKKYGPMKTNFSDLVVHMNSSKGGRQTVVRLMEKCFEITDDPMVGQQLARFHNDNGEFDLAELAINRSLRLKHENPYLVHTYGHILKSKMDSILNSCKGRTIETPKAITVIEIGLKAIEKFKETQEILKSKCDAIYTYNHPCFETEVSTALTLLEKSEKFEFFSNKTKLSSFLNDEESDERRYQDILTVCPSLNQIKKGSDWQIHVEMSLRSLEERDYQIKTYLHSVQVMNDEMLLLTLRGRFERIYGYSQDNELPKRNFAIGLMPLMKAFENNKKAFEQLVSHANANILRNNQEYVQLDDLLIYLGHSFIKHTMQMIQRKCTTEQYNNLLQYTTKLIAMQRKETKHSRVYMESYLYHGMLHWPSESRIGLRCGSLCPGNTYEKLMSDWKRAFNGNFCITAWDQRKTRPTIQFALGKGIPGNDIVVFQHIREEWYRRNKEHGRVRLAVLDDSFWSEEFVGKQLQRLTGFVQADGHTVIHKVKYLTRKHSFKIRTFKNYEEFINRKVTFVLCFAWNGLIASDLREFDTHDVQQPFRTPSQPDNPENSNFFYPRYMFRGQETSDCTDMKQTSEGDMPDNISNDVDINETATSGEIETSVKEVYDQAESSQTDQRRKETRTLYQRLEQTTGKKKGQTLGELRDGDGSPDSFSGAPTLEEKLLFAEQSRNAPGTSTADKFDGLSTPEKSDIEAQLPNEASDCVITSPILQERTDANGNTHIKPTGNNKSIPCRSSRTELTKGKKRNSRKDKKLWLQGLRQDADRPPDTTAPTPVVNTPLEETSSFGVIDNNHSENNDLKNKIQYGPGCQQHGPKAPDIDTDGKPSKTIAAEDGNIVTQLPNDPCGDVTIPLLQDQPDPPNLQLDVVRPKGNNKRTSHRTLQTIPPDGNIRVEEQPTIDTAANSESGKSVLKRLQCQEPVSQEHDVKIRLQSSGSVEANLPRQSHATASKTVPIEDRGADNTNTWYEDNSVMTLAQVVACPVQKPTETSKIDSKPGGMTTLKPKTKKKKTN